MATPIEFKGVEQSCLDSDVLSHCSSSEHSSDDAEYTHSGKIHTVPIELLPAVYDMLGVPLVIFHCRGLQTLPHDAALPVEHIFANKGWWSLMGDASLDDFIGRSDAIIYSANITRAFRRLLWKTQELGRHITRYRWTFRPGGVAAKCNSFQLVLNATPINILYSDGTVKRCMMQQVACIEPTTDFSVPDHLGSVGASVTRERAARPIPAAHPPTHTLPAATVRPVLKSMSLEQEDGDDSGDEELHSHVPTVSGKPQGSTFEDPESNYKYLFYAHAYMLASHISHSFRADTGELLSQNIAAIEFDEESEDARTTNIEAVHFQLRDRGITDPAPIAVSHLRGLFVNEAEYDEMMEACITRKSDYIKCVEVVSHVGGQRAFHNMRACYNTHPMDGQEIVTVNHVDVTAVKTKELVMQDQINTLETELLDARNLNAGVQPLLSDDADEDSTARARRLSLAALDKIVNSGFLRNIVHDSMSDDTDVARKARLRAGMFLRHGALVLPRTEDEWEQTFHEASTAPSMLSVMTSMATDASSPSTYTPSRASRQGSTTSLQPLDRDQMHRLAAACNGLEVANRWVDRLQDLASDSAAGGECGQYPALYLGQPTAVFLGGSCGKTTWRSDIAIPMFDAAGVKYYNPQRDDWSPELVTIEAKIKEECTLVLFVIDNATRALVSILEVVEHICRGKHTIIVLVDIEEPTDFDGTGVSASPNELKDLNRLRRYLRDVAIRHGVKIYSDMHEAMEVICDAHRRACLLRLDEHEHEHSDDGIDMGSVRDQMASLKETA